jgi:tRNA1(Val) A37 N6-methylase TrmN6
VAPIGTLSDGDSVFVGSPSKGNPPRVHWTEEVSGNAEARSALWRSESGTAPPARIVIVDDTLTADQAYRLACEGTAMLWRGDFHNARQLLQAMARRIDQQRARKAAKPSRTRAQSNAASKAPPAVEVASAMPPSDAFNRHRLAQSQRARTLGMLLIPVDAGYAIPLRRAPDVSKACRDAWGSGEEPCVTSLRELLGLIGAHEWRSKGLEVAAAGGRIHPHYGVFSPLRGEYIDLVATAPLPAALADVPRVFDIGTGTGVLAAVLARRAPEATVIATDQDPRALACARENIARLGLDSQVKVVQADLYPGTAADGQAALIVCNPPWIPARATSPLEHAIYDPGGRMLEGFLAGLASRLAPGGEGWLILSDIAEHLGLRNRDELLGAIAKAGLAVVGRVDVRPRHSRASDRSDPLHFARAAETTSLWRLAANATKR